MRKFFAVLVLLPGILFADGCWDLKQTSALEFDELNDKITFSLKDALDCEPVPFAVVNFGGVKLESDKKGEFSVPLDVLKEGQSIKLLIKADEYIPMFKKLRVEAGSIRGNKVLLSPILPIESIRFVLSWSDKPRDMDLHLLSENFHVSYRDTSNYKGKVKLDRDAKFGFGPETITLDKLDETQTYTLYVDRFSKVGKIDSSVSVAVYVNNRLDKRIKLASTQLRAVKVLEFTEGELHYINEAVREVP